MTPADLKKSLEEIHDDEATHPYTKLNIQLNIYMVELLHSILQELRAK